MINKKIIIIIGICFLIITPVYAADWDNVKSYDEEKKEVTVENLFGLGKEIAKVKLDTPLVVHTFPGYQKVAEFTVNSSSGYQEFLKEMEFYDLKRNNKSINRKYDLKYKVPYKVNVTDYYYTYDIKTLCNETKTDSKTLETNKICWEEKTNWKKIKNGSHIKTKYYWENYTSKNIPGGITTIGIFTNVKEGDYVEWIPELFGVRVEEWASFSSSLQEKVVYGWEFNEDSGEAVEVRGRLNSSDFQNGVTRGVSGKLDKANSYNAPSVQYLEFDSFSIDDFTADDGAYSVTAWVRPDFEDNEGANRYTIIRQRYSGDDNYALMYQYGKWNFKLDGQNNKQIYYNADFTKGDWIFLGMTYDGNGNAKGYINGAEVNSTSGILDMTGTSNMVIGTQQTYGLNWNGSIDQVIFYNDTLTGTDMSNIYNTGTGLEVFDSTPPIPPPTVTLNQPADLYNSSTDSITFNCSATGDYPIDNITLKINSNTYLYNFASVINASIEEAKTLSDGKYNWTCLAYNNESLSDEAANRSLIIDTTAPTLNIEYPIDSTVYFNDITRINITYSDDNAVTCLYNLNEGGGNQSFTCSDNVTGINAQSGWNNWTVYITDNFGHLTQESTYFRWNHEPAIVNNEPANASINTSASPTLSVNVTDEDLDTMNVKFYDGNNGVIDTQSSISNGSTVSYKWNGRNATTKYYWFAEVCDNYECVNSSLWEFTTEANPPPTVTLNQPTDNYLSPIDSITFNCSATDDQEITNITLFIDNIAVESQIYSGTNETSLQSIQTVTEGKHNWTCSAKDNKSAVDIATERIFYYDTTNPNVTINYPLNNGYIDSLLFNFTYNITDTTLDVCWYKTDIQRYYNSTNTVEGWWNVTSGGLGSPGMFDSNKANDGNWSSYAYGTQQGGDIYQNFTIPNETISANTTIKVYKESNRQDYNLFSCWNGTEYIKISNITQGTYTKTYKIPQECLIGENYIQRTRLYSDFLFPSGRTSLSLYESNVTFYTIENKINCSLNSHNITVTGGENQLYVYGKDLFNNVGFDSVNYTVIDLNVSTYQNKDSVLEGKDILYSIIINSSAPITINITLIYNNTEYDVTAFSKSGNIYNYSSKIKIPIGDGNGTGRDINTSWKYYISEIGKQFYSSNETTRVYSLDIDDCSSYSTQIINISLYDENSNSLMQLINRTATIEYYINISSGGGSTTFNNTLINTTSGIELCVNDIILNVTNVSLNSVISYKATDYAKEFFYYDGKLITKETAPLNIILRDLILSDTTSFIFQYKDIYDIPKENLVVEVMRQYLSEGEFKIVEREKTKDKGVTTIHLLEEDAVYKFNMYNKETLIDSSDNYKAVCQTIPCYLTLRDKDVIKGKDPNYENVKGIYKIEVNKNNREVSLPFELTSIQTMNLTLYSQDYGAAKDTIIDTTSLTASAGNISVQAPLSFENESLYVVVTVSNATATNNYVASSIIDFSNKTLVEIMGDFAWLLIAAIIGCMVLIGALHDNGVYIFGALGFVFIGGLAIVNVWTALPFVAALGGIIMFKVITSRRGRK